MFVGTTRELVCVSEIARRVLHSVWSLHFAHTMIGVVIGLLGVGLVSSTALPSSSRSVGSIRATWLDNFLNTDAVKNMRWDAAEAALGGLEGADVGTLTYGEFSGSGFHALLQLAVQESGRDPSSMVFCDLGSGAGRLTLSAAAAWPFRRCLGLELLEPLHKSALQMYEYATALADELGQKLAPCSFECVDMTSPEADEHLADVTIAFAFSTCFSDARFATALREKLPAGTLVVTVDALMPNAESPKGSPSAAGARYFHLVDSLSVSWHMQPDGDEIDQAGAEEGAAASFHTAYVWRLEEARPAMSIDYSVLTQRSWTRAIMPDGSMVVHDEEDEHQDEDEVGVGEDEAANQAHQES